MLSKILKINQIFIPFLLYIISAVGVFIHFFYDSPTDFSWISLILLLINMALMITYSNFISFFKGTHYFEFFAVAIIIILVSNFQDLSFFSGFLFLNISLLQLLDEKDMKDKILSPFDIGFFMAIATLLYPPFWIFILFLLLHYIILSKVQLQGFLLSLLGISTVGILTLEISIFFNINTILPYIQSYWNFGIDYNFNLKYLWFIPVFICMLISIFDYINHSNKHLAEKKVVYFDSMILLVFTLLYYILHGISSNNTLLLFAIPVSILLTNYMLYAKLIYKEIILCVFLISLILFKYAHLIELPEILKNISF